MSHLPLVFALLNSDNSNNELTYTGKNLIRKNYLRYVDFF